MKKYIITVALMAITFITIKANAQTTVAPTMSVARRIGAPVNQGPVNWIITTKKINKKEAVISISANIKNGFHIYSLNQAAGGPIKTTITFQSSPDFSIEGSTLEPKAIKATDKTYKVEVHYFERMVTFKQKIKLIKPQPIIKAVIEFMAGNADKNLAPDQYQFATIMK